VRALDDLNISPTYVKMHLEGEELNALEGAVGTIQRCRPIVAVTIYHGADGLWRIPVFLTDRLKNYVFYTRTDAWVGTGTVFYAVPRERCLTNHG